MTVSAAVQEARKQKQLERHKKKGSKDYPEWYASQPLQVERAKLHEAHQASLSALAAANEALAVAEITGEGLEEAKHARAVAALIAERSQPPGRSAGASASLSGV